MSLSSVLVDRARVVTNTARMTNGRPVKVEGTTVFDWEPGQWFACRLDSPAAPKARDAAGGRERPTQKPMLIYELEDESGGRVELHTDVRVEVDSEALGFQIFEVSGEPTLDRKKEDLVCGEVALSRVLDDQPEGLPHKGTTTLTIAASGSGTVV